MHILYFVHIKYLKNRKIIKKYIHIYNSEKYSI